MAKKINKDKNYKLTVFNNDHTPFNDIMLIFKAFGFTTLQAEQCAAIIHHKGKYNMFEGHYDELRNIQILLSESNIKSEIISDDPKQKQKSKT